MRTGSELTYAIPVETASGAVPVHISQKTHAKARRRKEQAMIRGSQGGIYGFDQDRFISIPVRFAPLREY